MPVLHSVSVFNVKALVRHFKPGKGPSRGLLGDGEIIANFRLKLYRLRPADVCDDRFDQFLAPRADSVNLYKVEGGGDLCGRLEQLGIF